MNIPTLENDVYDICVKQFINSSNIFETSKINYIEFSHRFIDPLKYQLIRIVIDIKPSMEIYIIEFDSNHIYVSTNSKHYAKTSRKVPLNYDKFSEDYNKLIAIVENYLNETIENFTDGKISYLSDDEILRNTQEYNLSDLMRKEIDAEIDAEIVQSILNMSKPTVTIKKDISSNFGKLNFDDIIP